MWWKKNTDDWGHEIFLLHTFVHCKIGHGRWYLKGGRYTLAPLGWSPDNWQRALLKCENNWRRREQLNAILFSLTNKL